MKICIFSNNYCRVKQFETADTRSILILIELLSHLDYLLVIEILSIIYLCFVNLDKFTHRIR